MKKLNLGLTIATLVFSSLATANSLPVSVMAQPSFEGLRLLITGKRKTTVQDVIVNNGYCRVAVDLDVYQKQRFIKGESVKSVSYPFTVNRGQTKGLTITSHNCVLQTADIITTEGTYNFYWD